MTRESIIKQKGQEVAFRYSCTVLLFISFSFLLFGIMRNDFTDILYEMNPYFLYFFFSVFMLLLTSYLLGGWVSYKIWIKGWNNLIAGVFYVFLLFVSMAFSIGLTQFFLEIDHTDLDLLHFLDSKVLPLIVSGAFIGIIPSLFLGVLFGLLIRRYGQNNNLELRPTYTNRIH